MATDLGKAYVQIVPSAKGISGSVSRLLKGEAESAGKSSGKSLGEKLVSGIKTAITAAGIGTFLKQAISEGAKLEQSIGGIETLFGTRGANSVEEYAQLVGKSVDQVRDKFSDLQSSQSTMLQYANEAWKTSGVSANTYMETVTSFSASLLQGLNGDTVAAAEIANRVMVDMSDNANKYGTDLSNIQNAYMGFAKQNYTMLDNLKLGYGGTKTEMQRLIKDAASMKDIQEKLGVTIDANSMSFDNVANAISVVQEHLGITGTTAKEAMTTVSGSMNAMKASYQNLLASLALGENVGQSLEALMTSSMTFAKNVMGMVGNIATELPGAISTAFSNLSETGQQLIRGLINGVKTGLPEFIQSFSTMLPQAVSSIASSATIFFNQGLVLIKNIVDGVVSGLPTLIDSFSSVFSTILETTSSMFSNFVRIGSEILQKLGEGMRTGIPTLLGNVLPMILNFTSSIRAQLPTLISSGTDMIMGLVQGFTASLPDLLAYVPLIVSDIAGLINDNVPIILAKGWDIIKALGQGLIEAAPALWANMGNIIQAVVDVIQAINWINLGQKVITLIKNGVQSLFNHLPDLMKNIGNTAKDFFHNIEWHDLGTAIIRLLGNGIKSIGNLIWDALKTIGTTAWDMFKSINWLGAGLAVIQFIVDGVKSIGNNIKESLTNLGNSAMSAFKSINWLSLGSNIISGIVSGISSGVGAVVDAAKSAAQAAFNAAKSFLGIRSPSRLFKYLGEMTDEGLAQGLTDNVGVVQDAMDDITKSMVGSYSPDLTAGYGVDGNISALNRSSVGGFTQTINNYSPKALSPSETARLTRNSTKQLALRLSMGG